jgi:hypothetical protein
MSKTSTTLYVVQDPYGNVLNGTASFERDMCKKKFLAFIEGRLIEENPALFQGYQDEGFKILSINLPKELDKFND